MHLLAMDLAVNPELIFKEGYGHILGHLFILEMVRKAGKFQYYLTLPYILPAKLLILEVLKYFSRKAIINSK